MQKVILIPRMPEYKRCLFTKRVIVINESFVPVGKISKRFPATGVIWHEGLSGRNDEYVASSYAKILELPQFNNFTSWVFWVDNCSGQNKCWTLFTMFVQMLNGDNSIEKVTLKYFITGHTFMSADQFHRCVEKEMKAAEVHDFKGFTKCVIRAGDAIDMDLLDFKQYTNGLSQGKQSKSTRPLLCNVAVVEFRKGSTNMFFKTEHDAPKFQECDFLTKKLKSMFMKRSYCAASRSSPRGIPASKKNAILSKLGNLMPENKLKFFENLAEMDVVDLIDEDDATDFD